MRTDRCVRYSHAHGPKADRPLNKKCIHSFCIWLGDRDKIAGTAACGSESRPHAGGSLLKITFQRLKRLFRINKFSFFPLGRLLFCSVPVTGAHNTSSMCIYVSAEARKINIGYYAAPVCHSSTQKNVISDVLNARLIKGKCLERLPIQFRQTRWMS
jgi:hypothetical protein